VGPTLWRQRVSGWFVRGQEGGNEKPDGVYEDAGDGET